MERQYKKTARFILEILLVMIDLRAGEISSRPGFMDATQSSPSFELHYILLISTLVF